MKHCRAYALAMNLDSHDPEDAKCLLKLMGRLVDIIEGFTPYNAHIDDRYGNPVSRHDLADPT